MVVNAALGGKSEKSGKDPNVKDLASGHATPEDAAAAINRALLIG